MCVYGHATTVDAMSPKTNLHAAGHLGVRLPATPPPRGALDNKELFIVEGSKNWRSTPGQPGGARKWRKMRRKKAPTLLQIVIELCR